MGATASSLVCVSESTPVYFAFLPFAVLPRRFTVPWFVHAWCLLPATTDALTIRARQVNERAARHHTILVSLSILKMAYALQLVSRCVTSTVLRLLSQHRSMGGKCATCIAMQKCCSACSHDSAEIRNMRSHQNCCKYMFAKIVRSKHA